MYRRVAPGLVDTTVHRAGLFANDWSILYLSVGFVLIVFAGWTVQNAARRIHHGPQPRLKSSSGTRRRTGTTPAAKLSQQADVEHFSSVWRPEIPPRSIGCSANPTVGSAERNAHRGPTNTSSQL